MQTSCIKDANKRHESAEGTLKRRDWPGTTLEQVETSIITLTLKVTMREEAPLWTALMGVRLSKQLTEGAKLPLEP